MNTSTNIVIVNKALRLIDNPLLEDLKGPTIFVYCLTPYYFSKAHYTDIPNVGENKFKYLFACIDKFKSELKEKTNCDLLVLEGSYKQVVDQIVSTIPSINSVKVRLLYQPYSYEKVYQSELQDAYSHLANSVKVVKDGYTLAPFNTALSFYNKSSTFFSFFNNYLNGLNCIKWTNNSLENIISVDTFNIKSTDSRADNMNFFYDMKAIINYKTNRHLISSKDIFTTKTEGALSLGSLSKVTAYALVINDKEASNEDKTEFIRSLAWNDYCYMIAEVKGNNIFYKNGLNLDINKGKVELIPDWIRGTGTEVKFYNKALNRLRTDGFLPNRVRMLLGYYIIKVMGYSPLALAEYFEHYLLCDQPANNWLGCHSCNGTGVDTIPGGRNFNIRKQLEQYDLNREYL